MTWLRITGAFALLLAAGAAAATRHSGWVFAAMAAGFIVRAVAWRNLAGSLRSSLPIVAFAAVLAAMQWIAHGQVSLLPLKAVAVFLLSTAALRSLPWSEMVRAIHPGSRLSGVVLFGFFAQHFTGILATESRRILQARALRLARRLGPGWFRSLVGAMAGIFRRALARAERFYAAQSLRGLGE